MSGSGGKRPSQHHLASDRRGVSEAIAALLMMVIAIAAGTMLYAYSATTFGTAYSQFSDRTNTNEDMAKERFAVLSIWSSTNQVNATVMNYGEIDLMIDAAYLNGTRVLSSVQLKLSSGQLIGLKFASTIQQGKTYVLIIVSKRGTTVATSWKA